MSNTQNTAKQGNRFILKDASDSGYSRLLSQQGKPVLDSDLSVLASLASFQHIGPYLGNGVPAGSNGFAVGNLNLELNDFDITAGLCLVNGQEARLKEATTYKTQPNNENVVSLPEGKSKVYLRVFPVEVNAQGGDTEDVGIETAVREKTEWEILVSTNEINAPDHFVLAEIDTTNNEVIDRRRRALTLAALRDELDRARGSMGELGQRLDISQGDDGKLRDGVVSKSVLANGAVPIQKLSSTLVFDESTSLLASEEKVLPILKADAHAFLLVSVRATNATGMPKVDWHLRARLFNISGPPREHFHEIVLVNKSNDRVTVSCKAYRLNEI
jgi:hypothetical protein